MNTPKSYAPEVRTGTDPKWYGNALRFRTMAEAEQSARELFERWTLCTDHRAVASDSTPNYYQVTARCIIPLVQVTRKSAFTGIKRTLCLPITPDQIEARNNGGLIQVCFPYLTADEREFYMTGITGDEWLAEFGTANDNDPNLDLDLMAW